MLNKKLLKHRVNVSILLDSTFHISDFSLQCLNFVKFVAVKTNFVLHLGHLSIGNTGLTCQLPFLLVYTLILAVLFDETASVR